MRKCKQKLYSYRWMCCHIKQNQQQTNVVVAFICNYKYKAKRDAGENFITDRLHTHTHICTKCACLCKTFTTMENYDFSKQIIFKSREIKCNSLSQIYAIYIF